MSAGTHARPARGLDLGSLWLDFNLSADVHMHAHELCPALDDIGPVVELVVGTRDQVAFSATTAEWVAIHRRIGEALAGAGVEGLGDGAQ